MLFGPVEIPFSGLDGPLGNHRCTVRPRRCGHTETVPVHSEVSRGHSICDVDKYTLVSVEAQRRPRTRSIDHNRSSSVGTIDCELGFCDDERLVAGNNSSRIIGGLHELAFNSTMVKTIIH